MPIIKIEPIPEPNCLSCVNHKEFSGEDFFEVYCQKLYEQEPPYPVCVEYEEQKERVVLDVEQAIEAIADKVHQGWMKEKLTQGFADHPFVGDVAALSCDVCWGHGKTYQGPNRHHSDMLPYVELPEYIKEYDRRTARMVFEWLQDNGYEVVERK